MKKPTRKSPTLTERLKKLEQLVKRQEKKIKELERKIDVVYEVDAPPIRNNNDNMLNRPGQL